MANARTYDTFCGDCEHYVYDPRAPLDVRGVRGECHYRPPVAVSLTEIEPWPPGMVFNVGTLNVQIVRATIWPEVGRDTVGCASFSYHREEQDHA
ncbi:MAG: hypothetical protein ACYCVW_16610 [Rhodocyclaceae bacterium]